MKTLFVSLAVASCRCVDGLGVAQTSLMPLMYAQDRGGGKPIAERKPPAKLGEMATKIGRQAWH